jgi:hypothetical protein
MARQERVSVRIECDGGCGASELERDAMSRGWRRVEVVASKVDGELVNRREVDLCPKCIDSIVFPGVNENWRPVK